jgi:hypothetical protein
MGVAGQKAEDKLMQLDLRRDLLLIDDLLYSYWLYLMKSSYSMDSFGELKVFRHDCDSL